MLNIFVCEDDFTHRHKITKCVENYILMEGLDAKLAISTETPYGIIGYLQENRVDGLYFLDVDLNSDIDGLVLAEKIRHYDPRGFIAFITMHGEALQLTFKYKVEALDFILKDAGNIEPQICECIKNAYEKYQENILAPSTQEKFVFKRSEGSFLSLPISKILFFEASPNKSHRVIVYSEDSVYDFYGSLSEVEKALNDSFFRCHKSYIVNLDKIVEVDINKATVNFEGELSCLISSRKIAKMKKLLKERCY